MTNMSIEKLSDFILANARSRFKDKVVILCEGRTNLSDRSNPSTVAKRRKLADATFFKRCVPSYWTYKKPQFIGCGTRESTIGTFFSLRKLISEKTDTFINPDKLFAIVDPDVQSTKIEEDYHHSNTNEIYNDLYYEGVLNGQKIQSNRILTLGLAVRENYFFEPDLVKERIKKFNPSICYKYAIERINSDNDIVCEKKKIKEEVFRRVSHVENIKLDCGRDELCQSYKDILGYNPKNPKRDQRLVIMSMLGFIKLKKHWENIDFKGKNNHSNRIIRNNTQLSIANYYSDNQLEEYHFTILFRELYKIEFGCYPEG
ncbi:hypothetical protein [Candidatus Uabimicrobium amorphum]|uniref:DUF4435 domain-containing protein n=1 Tax=Uabimicrobium amorphum TaxID=2596890 RepID=A0A5S9F4X3_UABAM|nr:hypothetical protein [Candidatus Uabimicrobium amorphum]BBM84672.1 hypothetical protein UABAM_03033 [Candidatus Uabimicrobium amorphum]